MTSPMQLLGIIQASSHLLVASSTIAYIGNPIRYNLSWPSPDHHSCMLYANRVFWKPLDAFAIGVTVTEGFRVMQVHDIWNKFPAESIISSRKVYWTDKQLLCQMYILIEHNLVLYHLDAMPFGRISIHLVKNMLFLDGMWKATCCGTTSH